MEPTKEKQFQNDVSNCEETKLYGKCYRFECLIYQCSLLLVRFLYVILIFQISRNNCLKLCPWFPLYPYLETKMLFRSKQNLGQKAS